MTTLFKWPPFPKSSLLPAGVVTVFPPPECTAVAGTTGVLAAAFDGFLAGAKGVVGAVGVVLVAALTAIGFAPRPERSDSSKG